MKADLSGARYPERPCFSREQKLLSRLAMELPELLYHLTKCRFHVAGHEDTFNEHHKHIGGYLRDRQQPTHPGSVYDTSRGSSRQTSRLSDLGFDAEGQFVFLPIQEMLLRWRHSGFSVNNSVRMAGDDHTARVSLAQYIARAPLSLEKLHYDQQDGKAVYHSAGLSRPRHFLHSPAARATYPVLWIVFIAQPFRQKRREPAWARMIAQVYEVNLISGELFAQQTARARWCVPVAHRKCECWPSLPMPPRRRRSFAT